MNKKKTGTHKLKERETHKEGLLLPANTESDSAPRPRPLHPSTRLDQAATIIEKQRDKRGHL